MIPSCLEILIVYLGEYEDLHMHIETLLLGAFVLFVEFVQIWAFDEILPAAAVFVYFNVKLAVIVFEIFCGIEWTAYYPLPYGSIPIFVVFKDSEGKDIGHTLTLRTKERSETVDVMKLKIFNLRDEYPVERQRLKLLVPGEASGAQLVDALDMLQENCTVICELVAEGQFALPSSSERPHTANTQNERHHHSRGKWDNNKIAKYIFGFKPAGDKENNPLNNKKLQRAQSCLAVLFFVYMVSKFIIQVFYTVLRSE